MGLLEKLPPYFERKPLVLLRFPDGLAEALGESKRGLGRFTLARPHDEFRDLKLPTICLVEMANGRSRKYYVGVVTSKAPVTTLDSRLTVIKLQRLNLASLNALSEKLPGRAFKNAFKSKLAIHNLALGLTPKLSVAVIEALSTDASNKRAIEIAARNVPKLRRVPAAEWEQFDAVKTAMAAFGLSKSEFSRFSDVPHDSDSTLNSLDLYPVHALEDNVIAKDAGEFPGFSLIERHVTGRAVFTRGNERLEIYTANRGPLEAVLGVDLIYINESAGNTVMLQYKMLEPHSNTVSGKTDWRLFPDRQLRREIERMKLPSIKRRLDDYRLHRSPFFFKLVKRRGDGESHQSFVISLDHLNQLLASSKGPRGGVRVSFDELEGVYLRDSDLAGLIRSGYIGTHRLESEHLQPIISEVANGNRALVLAWQRQIDWTEQT
jgi:hypothetical protein